MGSVVDDSLNDRLTLQKIRKQCGLQDIVVRSKETNL